MTSSTRDDGVMENSGGVIRSAERSMENRVAIDSEAMENSGARQVEEGGVGSVAVMPPVGMVLVGKGEFDRLLGRAIENAERESRLIAEAVRMEGEECARIADAMADGSSNDAIREALKLGAEAIRDRRKP